MEFLECSETTAALHEALAKAQGVIRDAEKTRENPHLKTKYATLASVWDACRAALADNGLSVTQHPLLAEPGTVQLYTRLGHQSGEFIASRFSLPCPKPDAQSVGSALTYARRYALAAVVGISPDDATDDDGHDASQGRGNQQQGRPDQRRDDRGQNQPRPLGTRQPHPQAAAAVQRNERPLPPPNGPERGAPSEGDLQLTGAPGTESSGDRAAAFRPPAGNGAPAGTVYHCEEEGCGVEIPPAVHAYSLHNFGVARCRTHQPAPKHRSTNAG